MSKMFFILTATSMFVSRLYPSTISSFSVSTSAFGNPVTCSKSGLGIGTISCSSFSPPNSDGAATASVTVTDNSLQLTLDSFHAAGADASASITHDDFYAVPVNGPIFALVNLTCSGLLIGHFSLGSTMVSPPVESFFSGASQGSGPCSYVYKLPRDLPADFLVSLFAVNNIVHLQTHIDGSGGVADNDVSLFVQLRVDGFQDANGNPIPATLVPEPGTLQTFMLCCLGIGALWSRKWFGSIRFCSK